MPEVDENPAEGFPGLLHPEGERPDIPLVAGAKDVLLERTAPLAGDDLDQRGLLRDRLVDDPAQRPVDVATPVVDVMQVERQLHSPILRSHCDQVASIAWASCLSPARSATCTRP